MCWWWGPVLALIPAVRRARFVSDGQGPGVVQVVEGRIPLHGALDRWRGLCR